MSFVFLFALRIYVNHEKPQSYSLMYFMCAHVHSKLFEVLQTLFVWKTIMVIFYTIVSEIIKLKRLLACLDGFLNSMMKSIREIFHCFCVKYLVSFVIETYDCFRKHGLKL